MDGGDELYQLATSHTMDGRVEYIHVIMHRVASLFLRIYILANRKQWKSARGCIRLLRRLRSKT